MELVRVFSLNIINYFKLRYGLTIAKQIKFIEKINGLYKEDPDFDFSTLPNDNCYITKVVKARIDNGNQAYEAIKATLDEPLHPFIPNNHLIVDINAAILQILITHNKVMTRRMTACFLLFLVAIMGGIMQNPQLMIGSALYVVLIAVILNPLDRLHRYSKIL